MQLYTKISIGLVAGAAAGWLVPEVAFIEPLGKAFLRLITMLVVPLVFASLVVGAAGLGDPRKLGRIGGKALGYYLVTTSIAVTIGLLLANAIRPGSGIDAEIKEKLLSEYAGTAGEALAKAGERPSLAEILLNMIPTNPFAALAQGDMLAIITFALLAGVALSLIPREKAEPVLRFFDGLNEVMMKLIGMVMELAPYGVFALVAAVVARYGPGILSTLVVYALVVAAGLALHLFGTYGTSVAVLSRRNPLAFFRALLPAQLIAFGTSSSNATLPATLRCVEEGLGVRKEVASFVLPLGATVNMDGTALYQGVATVFIAQVYGIDLSFEAQLQVVLTATLASIGTAGVPGAGVIMLLMVLRNAGIPEAGIALILGVDRLLDMCRTVVNVTGDASCALFVGREEAPEK
jgi:Na+/H+-dicarboxylate symporter